ncbi:hypothetical protein SAM23877_0276 [Streptomyces ambofaciens ATCC 23877]|uniref:Transposase IS110-like N-terminal domain-containing protein n=1 Tax=Streptomyces ambofaciens (strain ATCC 23877 / 3486 / DSM 40053 / JCM 4204 / NBRC 12836 / NRRL B-2516) TaxID=278992 RepID=A0A0K2AJR7_STRA7|nr:hypothetical protein SAM23877_0276 [Streptomyces ambofaciens ATCC 23877]
MTVTCGIDWAGDHHDVALVDHEGTLSARTRITDDLNGLHQLRDLLSAHSNTANTPIPLAIETSRGLPVACLRATGRLVYAINPMAAARYRDRHAVTRRKPDHLDAIVLANILRTHQAPHRHLPEDSELARAIAIMARAQQDAVRDRTQAGNKLRSHLREYFPGFLAAFQHNHEGISSSAAHTVLAVAPTPEQATKLTRTQLRSLLKRASRPWAVRPSPFSGNSMPPAPASMTSPKRRRSLPTQKASRHSPGPHRSPGRPANTSRSWPAGSRTSVWPRSATPGPSPA